MTQALEFVCPSCGLHTPAGRAHYGSIKYVPEGNCWMFSQRTQISWSLTCRPLLQLQLEPWFLEVSVGRWPVLSTHLHGLQMVGNFFLISPFLKIAQMSWVPTSLWDVNCWDMPVGRASSSSVLAGPSDLSVGIGDVSLCDVGAVHLDGASLPMSGELWCCFFVAVFALHGQP